MPHTTILAIETSCDETAAAVARDDGEEIEILSSVVSSQVKLHAPHGGVVPNLAAREHAKNLLPVLEEALAQAHTEMRGIDLIAVANRPGLIGALLVGTTAAKTLSYLWGKPLLGIHHLEGHIYANFICGNNKFQISNFKTNSKQKIQNQKFPILCLVVSGGHTELVLMRKPFSYEIIGETQDDAVGEAFDKVARILGMGYPGGPLISAAASARTNANLTQNNAGIHLPRSSAFIPRKSARQTVRLPRPMLRSKDLNFSFSGLKTAVLYRVKKFRSEHLLLEDDPLPAQFVQEMAKEFQNAAVEVLVQKTVKAAKKYKAASVLLAGGVSANTLLRETLQSALRSELPYLLFSLPSPHLCIDNAAMIAAAAAERWRSANAAERKKATKHWKTLETMANEALSAAP